MIYSLETKKIIWNITLSEEKSHSIYTVWEGYQGDNNAGDKTGEALPTRSLLTWILEEDSLDKDSMG